GFDAASHLEAGPWGIGKPVETARVGFTTRIAWLVAAQTAGANVVRTRRDGWVEIEVPASQTESFVSWVLSFGPDARVFAPRAIRDHIVARLVAPGERVPCLRGPAPGPLPGPLCGSGACWRPCRTSSATQGFASPTWRPCSALP